MLCPGRARAGVAASLERKEERSPLVWKSGCEGKKSKRGRESPRGSHERCYVGGRDDNFKEDVVHPLPSKRRSTIGHWCSSEPIFTWGSSLSSEDHNMEEEFGMGFQMEQGIRVNPLSRCPLSGNLSKEDTSASRDEVKEGLTGRVGFDPRGSSNMVSPSNSIIRGKGLIFEGICEIPGAKNLEENQYALSNQMTESFTPKESIFRLHKEDSGDFLIDGLSPRKWQSARVLCSLDIKVYSRRRTEAHRLLRPDGFGSEESALRLDSPFTEEEISKAIFQLDRDKAPGPDGFTIAVFQECWDVIKEDLSLQDNSQSALGRLRGVLHETIHYTQGAFVQGRQILDAVLIANEIVDERRRSGEEGVVFKIDFEKAYDHVKWDFLDHVLEKKGFSPRWRKWMSGCLSSVSYAILVNVADVLSRMLMRAEERNMMEGFRGGRAADSEESFVSVWAHFWAQGVGWPILYLGLPLGGNPKACGFWDPVIERISSRLDGWQKAYLSFWGRITLIQSCVTHLPWLGKQRDHLVRWDVVCKPKTIEGLGFGNIFLKESRSSREMVMESDGHIAVLGRLLYKSFRGFPCLLVLGPSRPFSWNLNFRCNLSDSEIEDLEGLMWSLDDLYLSPSDFPSKFVWNSQVPFKVKSFVCMGNQQIIFSSLFLDDWVVAQVISVS
ncbi:hypothetical protein CK203_101905 [Vitis vinifera]|uniref:Uncharacterized protein n=1 Tax=Vitis vinifera TaxID=29760 RepID=A0A438DIB8_VITVI|nr:hypothetical protein CK203_101905 [Vitis vinifera]